MTLFGSKWQTAESEKNVLYKYLEGKALFTGMLRLYAAIQREMTYNLQPEGKQAKEQVVHQSRRES
jgi:hypothetical protein